MCFNKVVDFYSDIEGGSQFISFHMTCDSFRELMNECENIKQYLNIHEADEVPGKIGKKWKYKIGFYEARDGIVTVGSI